MFMKFASRFTLRDAFLCTTLAAIGMVLATLPFGTRFGDRLWYFQLLPQILWLCGGALVGAAILLPFSKSAVGAVIGVFVHVVVFYTLFIPIKSLF
jgi:hypothetical protein